MSFPILYVEDDGNVREEMLHILNRRYSNIHVAANGLEAWELYKHIQPKVLIADLKMPGLDGIGLIEKIRSIDAGIYIIVTTAHSEKEDLISSIHLNVTRYLIKPIDIKEVTMRIDEILTEYDRLPSNSAVIPLSNRCAYDIEKRILYVENCPKKITKSETGILYLLTRHLNHPVTYEQFEYEVWKEMPMTKYALRTHIMQLRKKLCEDVVIRNVSGQGYQLSVSRP